MDTAVVSTSVIINGNYVNAIADKRHCECTARSDRTGTKEFLILNIIDNPIQGNNYCGSKVLISQERKTEMLQMACFFGGSINVTRDEIISIVLVKENANADTRCCIQMHSDPIGAVISLTCSAVDSGNLSTTLATSATYVSKNTSIFSSSESSTIGIMSHLIPEKTTNSSQHALAESDNTVYFAIGGVSGTVLIVLLITTVVVSKRHSTSQKTVEHRTQGEDNSNDGMHYNILYTSTKSSNDIIGVSQTKIQNKITNNIDGNYSTVDIPSEPNVFSINVSFTETYFSTHDPTHPPIAPNPKSEYSSRLECDNPTTDLEKSIITHIIAPGDSGCAYAIVNKCDKKITSSCRLQPLYGLN